MGLALISVVAAATMTAGAEDAMQGRATATPAACSLVSSADAAKLTGLKNLAGAKQIAGTGDGPGATNCGYLGSSLYVDVQPLQSATSFNAAADLARCVLDKAKRTCFITNSLNADVHLSAVITARTINPDGCAA